MRALGFERPPRPLLPSERALLTRALGDELLDLDRVRVVLARSLDTWVPGEGHVARAIGDTVFIPTLELGLDRDLSASDPDALVHELCHVAQYQRGGSVYIGDSVRRQLACVLRGRPRGEAYAWRAAIEGGARFAELGAEAQASFVEQAWRIERPSDRVRAALEDARAGRGWVGTGSGEV